MTRNDSTDTNRAVVEANWRRKMIDPIGQVWTPFGHLRGDVFNYSDARDPVTLAPLPSDTVLRGVAASGVLYSYPFVAHTALCVPRVRAHGADHRAPEQGRPAAPAGRGRQEPDLRRHAAVRYRQVLRLRPLRDRHPRQRRHAVHPASQQWRLCPVRVRPELPCCRREPVCRSGPRPDRQVLLFADQRARHQSLGLCHRPLSGADPRLEPHHPGPLRRQGLDAAPQRYDPAGLIWPAVRLGGLLLHAFRSCERPASTISRTL